jgi:hypothetical protein
MFYRQGFKVLKNCKVGGILEEARPIHDLLKGTGSQDIELKYMDKNKKL